MNMRHPGHLTLSLLCTALLASSALAQITPGNLVVTRIGTGAATLTSASTAVFLEEYTTAGALVQPPIAMPTAPSGLNLPITNNGSATSEGFITQSEDARYLITVGYGVAPGTVTVNTTTSLAVNRVIARIALDGTIDTTTALTDGFSGSNIRSAASSDGSQFWAAGTASPAATGGVRHTTLGATTSTQLSLTPTNMRVVNVYGGQVYCSSSSGTFLGVSTVGTGLSTTAGQTTTLLPGFPVVAGPSSYDYFFADANTLYVADDRASAFGGIQKWVFAAGTWTLAYTLQAATNIGCRSVSGFVNGGVTTLFATTNNSLLVTAVDAGIGSPFTTLVTAATNTALRGVRWVRTPASVVHSGTSCATSVGTPLISTNGNPITGNLGFQITASNTPFPTFVMFSLKVGPASLFGFPVPGTPACALIYVLPDVLLAELSDAFGNAATPLSIPANASLGGTVIAAQAVPFDVTLLGFDLPVGTTDVITITIGN